MHAYLIPYQTAVKLSQLKWKCQPIDFAWLQAIDIFNAPYPMIAFQTDHPSSISKGGLGKFLITHIGFKNLAQMGEQWNQHKTLFYSFLIIIVVILLMCYIIYNNKG